jgi:hypothetical protein
MADANPEIRIKSRPYNPSWIDRFTDWVATLPVSKWVFYIGFGFVLVLFQMLFLWLEGGLQFDALFPVIIFNGLLIADLIALIHMLDDQSVAALNSMKPSLAISEPEFDEFQYKLSTMPSRITSIVGLLMVAALILSELSGRVPIRYAAFEQLPVFAVVYHVIDKSSAFIVGVFVYHTIRQLRLVNGIYSNHTQINLFELKPLYAFSKVTATTAVGLILSVYVWMIINPELLADPTGLGGAAVFTILALVVFVWPLVGAHRIMQLEKERMLHDIDLQFQAVFALFNQRFGEGDHSAIERLNGTISSLEIQYRKIEAIPTWPWRPETVRSVLTAIALPLVLMVLQFFVERAFIR